MPMALSSGGYCNFGVGRELIRNLYAYLETRYDDHFQVYTHIGKHMVSTRRPFTDWYVVNWQAVSEKVWTILLDREWEIKDQK